MLSYFQGLLVSDHYIWVLKTSTNKASDHKEMADKDPVLTEHALWAVLLRVWVENFLSNPFPL